MTSLPNSPRGRRTRRRIGVPLVAIASIALGTGLLTTTDVAVASIVPTVPLATAANYSVLAGTTVTNTNLSVLGQSVGLSPGSSIVGFPPGIVLAPATIEATSPVTLQAQSDLTVAYDNAAGRSVEFTQTNPDLVGQTLIPGVYAASAKAPLSLSGQLVLDGQNDPNAVFIFQTDSTLITGSGSTIELINGASECNVFWQVGSSATLGTGSVFVGNILALTSITVNSAVVVHGRALARNGAVTLDNDTFTQPSCTPSTATAPSSTTTTTVPGATTTTAVGDVTTTTAAGATTSVASDTTLPATATTFDNTVTLPRTGKTVRSSSLLASAALILGGATLMAVRRRRPVS
jgi:LPXTG-motif cell wall-anchored protein